MMKNCDSLYTFYASLRGPRFKNGLSHQKGSTIMTVFSNQLQIQTKAWLVSFELIQSAICIEAMFIEFDGRCDQWPIMHHGQT